MEKTLIFVTGNQSKVREAEKIIGFPIETVKAAIDEIQSDDINEVVKKKAEAAYAQIHKPVIVDDVGMNIDVWGGFPGPFIKYLDVSDSNTKLLYVMRNESNRKVKIVCAIGFCDGERTEVFLGEVHGVLTMEEKGSDGWGFDPIFIPEGYDKTWAEMGAEMKNTLSHRNLALKNLKEFLTDYWK